MLDNLPEQGFGVLTGSHATSVDQRVLQQEHDRFTTHHASGANMLTKRGMLQELADALSFPEYFGFNLDALQDVMTDLSWLPQARGHILVLTSPGVVLAQDPDLLPALVDILLSAQVYFADVENAPNWDHQVRLFVILQVVPGGEDLSRWTRGGAPLTMMNGSTAP